MIDTVVAVGFKGLEFSYDLKRLNLVIGPMGCGKTSISDVIELITTGRIAGAGKTNQAIMDAFATNEKMYVGVSTNDQTFERRFIRNKKGTVSQKFRAGNSFVTKEDFISAFSTAGRPAIFNLNAFMLLSDEKKINKVFELYPPKGDVFSIHEKIEQVAEELNELNTNAAKLEGTIRKLTVDQAKIEMPPGSLAEIQQEIEKTAAEIRLARHNYNRQIKIEAEAAAKEAATKTEEKEESRSQLGGPVTHTARNSEDFTDTEDKKREEVVKKYSTVAPDPAEPGETGSLAKADPAALIQKIIDTMDEAGCTVCAAKLVAKQALKKL